MLYLCGVVCAVLSCGAYITVRWNLYEKNQAAHRKNVAGEFDE